MIKEAICYAVIFAVEALIAWFYYGNIFPLKQPQKNLVLSFILGYSLLFAVSFLDIPAMNMLVFFFVNFALVLYNYKQPIKTSVFQAAFLSFSNGAAEVLVNLGLTIISLDYNSYTYDFTFMLALSIASKLLYLFIVFLALRIFKPQSDNHSDSNLIILLGVMPVVSGFIVVTMTYIAMTAELGSFTELLVTISVLSLLIVNLAVLIIYGHINAIAEENAALNISKIQDEATAEYYILLRDQSDNQRIMIHDIRKHLDFVNDMLRAGNAAEAERYINELETLPSLKRTVKLCDDPLLNVILSRYIDSAQELGINFHCDIKSSGFSFMDATSVTALFSNLLSNAVEAAQESEEKRIDLSIVKNTNEEYIMVSIENSCNRTPETDINGNFKTTKTSQGVHGYGLKSINRVIQKYNGLSRPYYDADNKTFRFTIRFPLPAGKS